MPWDAPCQRAGRNFFWQLASVSRGKCAGSCRICQVKILLDRADSFPLKDPPCERIVSVSPEKTHLARDSIAIMPDAAYASTLSRFVDRAGTLYSLPIVAMRVLELTNHPKVDATALKECIENDPALTTKILRVVNSSLFGISREVSDLNQAIALLGTKPLKLLVLGFSLPERLFAGVAGDILGHYWRRTLTKAIAARELCDANWKQGGDEAFIAGLLGDVGVLVLLKDLGEPYACFLQKVVDENGNLLAMETEALGFDHSELSARLLQKWGLPESFTRAIAAAKVVDELRRIPGRAAALPQILHLAELLTQLVSERRIGALPDLLDAARIYRGISRTQITSLVEKLGEKVSQLADVLSLELPNHKEFCEVLAEAHAQLAEVATEAAIELLDRKPLENDMLERMLAETKALSAAAQVVARAPLPQIPPLTEPDRQETDTSAAGRGGAGNSTAGRTLRPHSARPTGEDQAKHSYSQSFAHSPAAAHATADAAASSGENEEGDDPMLLDPLVATVDLCRQERCALSLLLLELDRFEQVLSNYGPKVTRKLSIVLDTVCKVLDHPGKKVVRMGDVCQAIILPACERRQGVELANELLRTVRLLVERQFAGGPLPVTISVGVATVAAPRKNFPPHDLIEAAERCLYGGHVGGGNAVKSIEIY
jgi:HD-like signal output (HDOD) protein/GGDEF domain-containing protein